MDTPQGNFNTTTLDYLEQGFQLISFDWRYLYLNAAAVRQSKFAKEEIIGCTMMEKYPGIERTGMFHLLSICMKERISERIENEFVYPDKTARWFELHIQPVPEGIFVISVDITERKQLETELLKRNDNLEELVLTRTLQLESRNKDITDSLHYAKNIQYALLPDSSGLLKLFPESFLIYKPKDIVSGDFYWYQEIGDEVILAVADCTGHGIPGAMLSIIGIEKLHAILQKNSEPTEVLKQLNINIRIALSQKNSKGDITDGMDIALCLINRKTGKLTYAGANRPFWLLRKDGAIIEEIKATKNAIGGNTEDDQHFESCELQLKKGDTFFLFTDGYPDTFGGNNGKKLMKKEFKKMLVDIRSISMKKQEQHLDGFIEDWKAGTEQVDDILVVGVKF